MIKLDDLARLDAALRQVHTANALLLVEADEEETQVLAEIAGRVEQSQFKAKSLRVMPAVHG